MRRSRVEESRRGGGEAKTGKHFVELDGAVGFVPLVERQSHSHSHPKVLWCFEPLSILMDQISIVQGLQTDKLKLFVPLNTERFRQHIQIEAQESWRKPFDRDSLPN